MSRWIDADVLKNKLQQHHDFFVNAWGGFMEMPIQDKARCDELSNSIAEIFNAPTIDIITCAECKYHEDFPTGRSPITCSLSWGGVFENDFCSYGERKESR